MKIPVISIGNSKGFRIPQLILRECSVHEEVELEVCNGEIVLKPIRKREFVPTFSNIPRMTDMEVQLMLQKTDMTTLAIALAGAAKAVKEKIYANMSERAGKLIRQDVGRMEKMDAREIFIETQRARLCRHLPDTRE